MDRNQMAMAVRACYIHPRGCHLTALFHFTAAKA
jgi:hypothetical protein